MNRRISVRALLSVPWLMLLAACGSERDASANACSFEPCGGDLTGRWTMESLCGTLPGDVTLSMQSAGVVSDATFRVSGSYEFDAAGTFRMDARVTLQASIVVSQECARDVGLRRELTVEDCQSLQDPMTEDEGVTQTVCSLRERACICEAESTAPQSQVTGVYSVDGSTLTENGRDVSSYCVDGSQLTIASEGQKGRFVLRMRRAD